MDSEFVVDVQPSEISIALLENKRLVELNRESREARFAVGNIYLGKVKKLMPGLNAAFVDVGFEKDAFLHYLDLGSNFNTLNHFTTQVLSDRKKAPAKHKVKQHPEIEKNGSIGEVLKAGQDILVQVAKEPISTKGPRLTAEISIAGRFLVLIPFADKVSVSQKITSEEERIRLKQLIQSIKPKGFGVIVRTVAEEKKVAELDNELKILVKRWEEALIKLQQTKGISLILEELGRTVGIIRDLFNTSYNNIHVNDPDIFTEVRDYIELIAPESKDIVKLYKDDIPIFDHFGITKQIKSSFGKTVSFKSGAYLIIEHTEALHVIDVNSGNRSKNSSGQEGNALDVNLAAADEIARQLRLRDMGGIIVIDFIDMHESENRQKLYDRMREAMSNDRAKHNILPLSKFGLLQMTRQRVRPATDINIEEKCPTCFGTGKMQPSILFVDQIEEKIDHLVNGLKIKKFVLYLHPYVEAFISKGINSLKLKWKLKYGVGCKIIASQDIGFLQYKFYDTKGNEINLKQELEKHAEIKA
ncbi:MAG: Rne/Rng family ribonuclease [Paludibacter sp.]|nr:Rne/Rng family ribonuclease [Paludibacter sp.]MDD4197904.1 Rne/Rng family ribonuclease [Paludibacter sp.]MDD4427543.1 Rne/Rng family ribonuclease [Paludibacter sp.]